MDSTFAARLRWEPGRGGCARRNGRTVALQAAPDLGAGPVYSCDYIPCAVFLVSPAAHEPERLMEACEVAAAERLLREIVPSCVAPLA